MFNETAVQTHFERFFYPSITKILEQHNAMIAGGAPLDISMNRTPKDYDIYFTNAEDHAKVLAHLRYLYNNRPKWSPLTVYSTPNSTTFVFPRSHNMITAQIINPQYFCQTHEETLNTFDLKICRVGFLMKDKSVIYGNGFKESHELHDMGIDPDADNRTYSTLLRIMKYKEKGYTFTSTDMIKLYMRIANIKTLERFQEEFKVISEGLDAKSNMLLQEYRDAFETKETKKRRLIEAKVKGEQKFEASTWPDITI